MRKQGVQLSTSCAVQGCDPSTASKRRSLHWGSRFCSSRRIKSSALETCAMTRNWSGDMSRLTEPITNGSAPGDTQILGLALNRQRFAGLRHTDHRPPSCVGSHGNIAVPSRRHGLSLARSRAAEESAWANAISTQRSATSRNPLPPLRNQPRLRRKGDLATQAERQRLKQQRPATELSSLRRLAPLYQTPRQLYPLRRSLKKHSCRKKFTCR